MENFTTQEHAQRNSSYELEAVNNPGKTIARMREEQRKRNLVNGIAMGALALAVVVTGVSLGATSADNTQLKAQNTRLEAENAVLTQQATYSLRSASNNNPEQNTTGEETVDLEESHRPNRRCRQTNDNSRYNTTNNNQQQTAARPQPRRRLTEQQRAANNRRRQHYTEMLSRVDNISDTGREPMPMPKAPAPTPTTESITHHQELAFELNAIPAYQNWSIL